MLQRGRLALLAAGILWSLGGVFIKRLPAGPLAITFYRSLFAALTLLPLAAVRSRSGARTAASKGTAKARIAVDRWDSMRARAGGLGVSILLFAALLVTFVAATKLTTAANAIILQYTAPIYVIGLSALLLREPPQRADRAGLALCMAGIAVIFFGSYRSGSSGAGLALALLSGACFGLFMLWQRRLRDVDPMLLAGLNNAGAALILSTSLPWAGPVGPGALVTLVFMGVIQIAVPYTLFTWALQHVTGPEASLLTLIEPVLNPVWVALFAGEWPAITTVIGGVLILLALALRYTVWGSSSRDLS